MGSWERTGPLEASDTEEFIPTHRLFGDLTNAHKKGWGQGESQSFPKSSGPGEGHGGPQKKAQSLLYDKSLKLPERYS